MLATSFVDDRAIEVGAPAAKLGGASLEGALLVELRQDGLRLAGERLTAPQLLGRLQEHAVRNPAQRVLVAPAPGVSLQDAVSLLRSEEHTSELQSLMRSSYAAFCLKKNNRHT